MDGAYSLVNGGYWVPCLSFQDLENTYSLLPVCFERLSRSGPPEGGEVECVVGFGVED